ncbi:MAG: cyclic nucleotide-binding domain-containing protein [Burkholderiales bacterium]|nr:cyclic nucleotide-binding domain-containing protein [Opitutaceae bacterium]
MSDHASGSAPDLRDTRERPGTTVAYDDNGVARVSRGKPRLFSAPANQTQTRPPLPSTPTGSPLPRNVAQIDQSTLLSVSRLTLSRDLNVWTQHIDRIVVSYQPARRHLVLTPLQWTVLQTFDQPQTAPSALKHLIHSRGCIPLREFYELILQACDQGILQTPGYSMPPVATPTPWSFSLPHQLLRPLGVGLLVTTIILLFLHPLQVPAQAHWWAAGWLLFCVASSLGAFLSAGVLHAAEGLIHRPRFIGRSAFPRLVIDHDGHPTDGLDVDLAMAQLIPFAALTLLALLYLPALALPLFCGLLWTLSPFGQNAGLRLLRAFRHSPRLSTAQNYRFKPNQTFAHRLRQRVDVKELRFLAMRAGYLGMWILLIGLTWASTTNLDLASIWQDTLRPDLPIILAVALGGLLSFSLLGALFVAGTLARENWRTRRDALRAGQDAATPRHPPAPAAADLATFLSETHPFQSLPAKYRELLAERIRQTPFVAGETLIEAGDKRRRFYLLYSGTVQRGSEDGQKTGAPLESGTILGESVLLNGGAQPATFRGIRPGILLSFNHEAYDELVAPGIPRHKIEDAVQKIGFLRRIALSRSWSPHVLDSFARRAVTHSFEYSTTLLEADQENLWFYLLEEGELRVMRNGRKVGRILAGDFFGEISLLQNSRTTAQVVGHHAGRYLAVPKQDFLTFLTQNPEIAMQFEAIASRRLGHPLFPL